MNERITENLVRDQLRKFGYYSEENQIVVEEQKSQIKRVQTLLKTASKAGTGKGGYPEFIINWEVDPNFLIVIECKADTKYHESPSLDKVKDYAVDGVLHYAKALSKEFTVLAIAVSGTTAESMKVSNFLYPCGGTEHKVLANQDGLSINEIVSFNDYYKLASYDPEVERKRHHDLIAFSKKLH